MPRVEAADDTHVTVADDPGGAVATLLERLLDDDAPLERLRRGAESELRVGELRIERVAGGWRIGETTTLAFDDIEAMYDLAYEMRRMHWLEQFPIGATTGGFRIAEHLAGGPDRGLYRGDRVLISTSAPQRRSLDELVLALGLDAPGIARLRHVGPIDGADQIAVVEDEPAGAPVVGPEPMTRVAALAIGTANIVAAAHARSLVLGGLRPQLIYADGDRVTGVAPRCEPFQATARPRGYGVAPCFDDCYLAPEVIAGEPATTRSDVFALCATIATWATGEHPYEGVGANQIVAIATGRRRPWRGDRMLGLVVDGGLAGPTERTSLHDLIGRLVEL